MDYKARNHKLRLLVKKLNADRKKRNKQVDILCNDLVTAQREFVEHYKKISFVANFYELIIGTTDLSALLQKAGKLIKNNLTDSEVTFFMPEGDQHQMFMVDIVEALASRNQRLENFIDNDIVRQVIFGNKVCSLNDLYSMGLEGDLNFLKNVSAATIPLEVFGTSIGFVLLWRDSAGDVSQEDIDCVSAVAPGLTQAIESCQVLTHSGS